MSSRRELFLEEIGLTPLWRSKAGDLAGGSDKQADPTVIAAALVPVVAKSAAGQPVIDADDRAGRIARTDWPGLKAAVAACTACGLRKTCTQTVFGIGDEQADWLLVGEAPGAEEDARGEPFVGQAGKLLDSMLAGIDLKRGEDVYIANVLKCRPPGNRNPEHAEVALCSPFLARQVELLRPKLILAMGRFACQALLDTDASIASLRGRLHRYQGVPLIVSYHPAYLLRSLPDKAKAWEDLCFARRTMAELRSESHTQD
jgi:uracil-DNA glycosylase family 4